MPSCVCVCVCVCACVVNVCLAVCCLPQGINAALFWDKVNFTEYIPMVPTSAITGDGMGDLIALVVTYSQKVLAEKLMFSRHLQAIVMEVRRQHCHTPTTFFPPITLPLPNTNSFGTGVFFFGMEGGRRH